VTEKPIKDILSSLFKHSPTVQKSGEELLFYCPKCDHYKKKLNINIVSGYYHCWVCNFRGKGFISLLKNLKAPSEYYSLLDIKVKKTDFNKQENKVLSLPEDFHPLYKKSKDFNYKHALNYCFNRGLTVHEIIRYNIGYCKEGNFKNRVIVPSYDKDKKLNFYCGRDFFDGYMKYRLCESSKNIVGFESLTDFRYPITLVEGVFDAFSVKYNVIPLFGKLLSENLKLKLLKSPPPRVNVLLDIDAIKDSLKICEYLVQNNINTYLVILDGKDPNEIGFKKTWNIINNTVQLNESGLFKLKIKYNL